MTSVELKGLTVSYGETPVFTGLSLKVAEGELMAVLGPSGCGKTTVLKTIAGLLQPSEGQVVLGSEPVTTVPAEQRGIAMVFQQPLLFPHMSVGDNVGFGLKMRRLPGDEIRRRVDDALNLVRLPGMQERRATQLSGGQEQRVALARALVTNPRLLLLDEPFSALDQELRDEMRGLVRSLQRKLGVTTIFVTHDQHEAAVLADRIALMLGGGVAQVGEPREFYESPNSPQAARFFNWQLFEGEFSQGQLVTPIGAFSIDASCSEGERVVIGFRAENARLDNTCGETAAEHCLSGRIQDVVHLGSAIRYEVSAVSGVTVRVEQRDLINSQKEVMVRIPREATRLFFVAREPTVQQPPVQQWRKYP